MLQLLLAEVSVTDLICPRIVPLSQPELVRLEVHDDVLAAAVRHAGAAAAGPRGEAPAAAVRPAPRAAAQLQYYGHVTRCPPITAHLPTDPARGSTLIGRQEAIDGCVGHRGEVAPLCLAPVILSCDLSVS